MIKANFKKTLLNTTAVLIIFLVDRISKIYVLKLVELENKVDFYLTDYFNIYLIWNKGIAFGILSIDDAYIYNIISLLIAFIVIVILLMIIKTSGFKKYCLLFILGGALGNLFDRVYFSAVPDFIDFHIGNFHWFIFNVADIFITIGVICLIYAEIFFNKKKDE
jgi:signal peptidase II